MSDTQIYWDQRSVRKSFIDYFVKNQHVIIPSSSLVPHDDPSLLFSNSGMTQFKKIFINQNDNPKFNKLTRACNLQKCIRAGGKHNDLDDVGKDSYHHTFFEMAGNWSFGYRESEENDSLEGPYFKYEAIEMAWELLTQIYKIDKNRLYVTYFEGNKELNIEEDKETKEIWKKYVSENRILPFGLKENFWEMGYTGPCGPCTEIHYDRIGDRNASNLVNKDDPTVIEIWNLVFMQFNRISEGKLEILPFKHVDTGAGFERLVSVLQNKKSNYETDIFKPIIETIKVVTDAPYYTDKYGKDDVDFIDTAYRVIADHARTMIFAISDGVSPSATERGYVIRRVIRRAIRYGKKLGADSGFLTKLIEKVIDILKNDYPELIENRHKILEIVDREEKQFTRTINKGLKLFHKLTNEKNELLTKDAFLLYSSCGFPLDIIKQISEESNLKFDIDGFNKYLEEDINKSKQKQKFK